MRDLTDDLLKEAVALIDRFRSGLLSDEELSSIAQRLDTLLPDPHWYDYTIDHVPELPAEQIVRRAFSYRPIQL
jgi:hypothetical protein